MKTKAMNDKATKDIEKLMDGPLHYGTLWGNEKRGFKAFDEERRFIAVYETRDAAIQAVRVRNREILVASTIKLARRLNAFARRLNAEERAALEAALHGRRRPTAKVPNVDRPPEPARRPK